MMERLLIERFLPDYDVRQHHAIAVRAQPQPAYRAVEQVDISRSALVRVLFRLRGLPAAGPLTLRNLSNLGFTVLDEDPGTEIVLGLTGRFWRRRGDLRRTDPEEFQQFSQPGYVKAAWNFRVEDAGADASTVSTETRVVATDPDSRRRFLRYWRLIHPFSAVIRRRIVALISDLAQRP